MQDSHNIPRAGELDPLSSKSFAPVHWTLDIDTQTFTCTSDSPASKRSSPFCFQTLEEWLALMNVATQEKVEQLLEAALTSGDKLSINALLMASERFCYAIFSVEKLSKYVLQGEILPIFELTQSHQQGLWLDNLLSFAPWGVLISDQDNKILGCNRTFEQFTGFHSIDLLGLNSEFLFSDEALPLNAYVDSLPQKVTMTCASGQEHHYYCSVLLMPAEGQAVYVSFYSPQIEENKQAVNGSIANKQWFLEQFEALYQQRLVDELYIVMTLNIEHPISSAQQTSLNEVMACLKESRLFGQIKEGLYLVCVTCPLPFSGEAYRYVHARIRTFFHELRKVDSHLHKLCTSGKIGVSILGLDARSTKMAVTHSVQAILEQQSESGLQKIRFFDSQLHRQIKKRRLLEELVSEAIKKQTLTVRYQPIVETQTWQISSYEALCRFSLPTSLNVTNSELIAIAEDLDLVSDLDIQVLHTALDQISELQELHDYPIRLTFNISANTKQGFPELLGYLIALIDNHSVRADQIIIDLIQANTHTASIVQSTELKVLRSKGVQVAIDDMGLDYSLLEHLPLSEFDYLKISRRCLDAIKSKSHRYKVIKMLVELCHSLGVQVIADGVESLEEASLLADAGVDFMQGFLFSPPSAASNLKTVSSQIIEKIKPLLNHREDKQPLRLVTLHHSHTPRLDPGDPLSLAFQYFQTPETEVLPVINANECVGIVDRQTLNLHLTPTMGTELETMKEAGRWHRPVNQIMDLSFTKLDANTDIQQITYLICEQNLAFPWILVDGKQFKGIITQQIIVNHLAQLQHASVAEAEFSI
ncbi:EAL domain-containing protein [Vibrio cincinnatiensis]|uniref:EAL domain-containing protein n=1 Tax=Vibrio cincinnatiensis TaxID=675 RepID=UPI001EE0B52B|nr:EAL domain-containing protein [Vibrio cincinnatiensis]MCG3732140.1 EAL domain-containing protein [Vibrio cincinnatiensis]MCG3739562.1 EAL domain-containing protein [Vibrio cincinnatiensis]MCG3742934.1 EAL domain-containing protein [Vibrio cincinnatiensis]